MQELTPTSLENVFAELEKETGKLVLVVFKTETSMVDFFNAIADQIYRGELSNVFGGRKNNHIEMALFNTFQEYQWEKPDYILYEHGLDVEIAFEVKSNDSDADELDIFLNEFNRRK